MTKPKPESFDVEVVYRRKVVFRRVRAEDMTEARKEGEQRALSHSTPDEVEWERVEAVEVRRST